MTCIVGYVKNGKVYMGGDSAGVSGLDISIRSDAKVFKVQEFLIGYTSSFRMGQLLRFKLWVREQTKQQSDYEYMCTEFIDSVKTCLIDGGYATVASNEIEIGTFLVGYKGKLYTICSDLQVGETSDQYDSVGCGSHYALGALQVLDKKLTGKAIVTQALETAVKFSGGVRPPFNVMEI